MWCIEINAWTVGVANIPVVATAPGGDEEVNKESTKF